MTSPEPLVTAVDVVQVLRQHRVDALGGCTCGVAFSSRIGDTIAALEHLGEAIAGMVVEADRVRAQKRGNTVARGAAGPTRVLACELDLIHLGRTITAHTGPREDPHEHVGALLSAETLADPPVTNIQLADDDGMRTIAVSPGSWVELA